MAALAALGLLACGDRRVDDEPPPGDLDAVSDTLIRMPADTLGAADTAGIDRSPTPGEAPPGGTTINFETGTATTADGREVPVGGVSTGGVTTREGAGADTAAAPR
jgi:hypothetical protein